MNKRLVVDVTFFVVVIVISIASLFISAKYVKDHEAYKRNTINHFVE